jgi:hypothetical protein
VNQRPWKNDFHTQTTCRNAIYPEFGSASASLHATKNFQKGSNLILQIKTFNDLLRTMQ